MRHIYWVLALSGCVKYGPVQAMHTDIEDQLIIANENIWTITLKFTSRI